MSGTEWAALITAVGTSLALLLGLLGRAVVYVVQTILDAYKRQAEATMVAKDRDLVAKDATIAELKAEIMRLHGVVEEIHGVRKIVTDIAAMIQSLLRELSRS